MPVGPGGSGGGEWAVVCEDLTRDFGGARALDGVTLTVPRGTVFGFIGPNGAGKTTTIRLLLGLIAPTSGRVRVLGRDLPAAGADVRRRTGTVLEDHGLYEGLSVRASLEFAAGSFGLDRVAAAERVEQVVDALGLADRLDERPQHLSRGIRQRMAVARALVGRPELLVLDEPTNGLDAAAAAGLRREVLDLVTGGTTVFLTTHLLAEAERLCDLVTVVKQGRVIASGTPTELRRGTSVRRVRVEGRGVVNAAATALPRDAWTAVGREGVTVEVEGLDEVPVVVAALVRAGAGLHRVEPEDQTLEAAFLSLISDDETPESVRLAADGVTP
ncbi:MAG TPA: ABC transporter ATP-binding protein [Egibacteraceae bacterium]|nr:ABC transporter ATP-binding protein [Egibacteraceae bacterium]